MGKKSPQLSDLMAEEVEMAVTRRKIEATPPPTPPTTPPLTPTLPEMFENIHYGCHVCEGHIYDWICLPLVPEEEFAKKIRPRALKRAAQKIAEIIYRIIVAYEHIRSRIEGEYCSLVVSEANKYNRDWWHERSIPAQHYPAFKLAERKFFAEALRRFETRSDIEALKALVEDMSCLKRGVDVEEWLGVWLMTFWEFVPSLHKEHMGFKPMTGGGPAPGLRSHQPLPPKKVEAAADLSSDTQYLPPPRVSATPPPPPPIPTISNIPNNSPFQAPQLSFEIDELYY